MFLWKYHFRKMEHKIHHSYFCHRGRSRLMCPMRKEGKAILWRNWETSYNHNKPRQFQWKRRRADQRKCLLTCLTTWRKHHNHIWVWSSVAKLNPSSLLFTARFALIFQTSWKIQRVGWTNRRVIWQRYVVMDWIIESWNLTPRLGNRLWRRRVLIATHPPFSPFGIFDPIQSIIAIGISTLKNSRILKGEN